MIKMSLKNQVLASKPKSDYAVNSPSAEAAICINCTKKKCKGECKDFYAALKKLREEEK